MVKYLNSPLKITGTAIVLCGALIPVFTLGQFVFLGISVLSLGILVHVTDNILMRSQMGPREKRIFQFALLLFVLLFCGVLVLDFFDVITIRI